MNQRRAVVFQLGSLEDTLQSLMALRAAKQLYPELEVTLVVRDRFKDAAERVPWLSRVIVLPASELVSTKKSDQARSLAQLGAWVAPLLEVHWDYVVNWTFSEASTYLATLVTGKTRLGSFCRRDLMPINVDGWSQFVHGVIQGGIEQNIHLTDLWTTQLLTALQIQEGPPADRPPPPVTGKGFFNLAVSREDIVVALATARRWIGVEVSADPLKVGLSSSDWISCARAVLGKRAEVHIALLGETVDDAGRDAIRELVRDFPNRVLNLVGQADFDLRAAVVARCHWLLAGDGAAIHLAALLGTQVLYAPAEQTRYLETGPYGNGHYIVRSRSEARLSPEQVASVFFFAASEWSIHKAASLARHLEEQGLGAAASELSVSRSRIRTSAEGGGVRYESVMQEAWPMRQWNAYAIGQLARHWYCGWTTAFDKELSVNELSPELIVALRGLDEILSGCTATLARAGGSARDLVRDASRLVSARLMAIEDRERLGQQLSGLREIDSLLARLGRLHPIVAALSNLRAVMFNDLDDRDLVALGRAAEGAYLQLGEGVEVIRKSIAETLALAKPRAVGKTNILPFVEATT